jgi:hypothetical protein
MTEEHITQKIRADLERNVFLKRPMPPPDPTVRPTDPCRWCTGTIWWRTIGTLRLHCQGCNPCPDAATTAYWYISQEQP